MVGLATIVVIIIVWGSVSRPLDRRGVTSAIVFVGAGFVIGTSALGLARRVSREHRRANASPRSPSYCCSSAMPRVSTSARCATSSAGRAASCSSACR